MAATSVTITVTEAQAKRVEEALCKSQQLPVTGPNTKKVIVALIERAVLTQLQEEASQNAANGVAPVEGVS